MNRPGEASQPTEAVRKMVDERVREVESRLQAAMAEQSLTIVELERRVKALEEALRLISSGVRG